MSDGASVLLLAGPTASGKSALALAIAERIGGTIINTDSMQVYHELRVLTARPTPEEEARVPHRLYGVRRAAEAGSVAWWHDAALAAIHEVTADGRLPILTGGSGLYFAALTGGLADIPDPGEVARTEARQLLAEIGPAALHARLHEADPATAARLKPADSQRIARAWEVWRGTGQGLAAWQGLAATRWAVAEGAGSPPFRFCAIRLDPPREALRDAIARRFDLMLRNGAVGEVEALLSQNLNPALPAMRAHGVPELSAYLRGQITLEEVRRRIETATVRYTKRQATWFRHHALASQTRTRIFCSRFPDVEQFSEREMRSLFAFIEDKG